MYASHADIADKSPYENFTEATLAGATNLSPTPTATLKIVTDAAGKEMAEVTVSYRFHPLLPLKIKSELVLTHTARMRVYPSGEEDGK